MSKLRIAINQPRSSYYIGGAETVSLEHAKSFVALGHTVTFITIAPQSIGKEYSSQYVNLKERYTDIEFVELSQEPRAAEWYATEPGENRDRWNVESLHYIAPLYSYLIRTDRPFDVMLSYYKFDALVVPRNIVLTNALYLCGIPKSNNEFMSSYLAMYDTIAAITDETAAYWLQYTNKKISTVATGVDSERFIPCREPSDPKRQCVRIAFLGRLIERKGCDLLLDALMILPAEDLRKIEVVIAGTGPQLRHLQDKATLLGGGLSINFIGETDHPEDVLGLADICIFPSRYGEGLQGVVLEAMSCGAYVIASNTATNEAILGEGRGLCLPCTDVRALARSIHDAISNDRLRINASGKAREYVIVNYEWNNVSAKLLKELT
ncbi:MAG: glycosyltransferase family 4 protein [Candidatus Saccharimonas sp.]